MRIRAARRTAPSGRGQCDGVRVQRSDGENARRQSERNHSVCEHGSRWQQSGLRRLALLSDSMRIVFRNPAMEASVYEQQPHSVSSRAHRHGQRQRQVHWQWNAELRDGVGDHPGSVPSARRPEHHIVPVLRFQPACHA